MVNFFHTTLSLFLFITLWPHASYAIYNGTPQFHERVGTIQDASGSCKAILYDDDIVIITAHCIDNTAENTKFILQDSPRVIPKKSYEIETIKIHPEYKNLPLTQLDIFEDLTHSVVNDIAVLKLKTPIANAKLFKKLHLAQSDKLENTSGSVWGLDHDSGDIFNLKKAMMNIDSIAPLLEPASVIKLSSLSSENKKDGKACDGDSGGPFTIEVNHEEYLVGITTYIWKDSLLWDPSFFDLPIKQQCINGNIRVASIPYFYNWLAQTINELRGKSTYPPLEIKQEIKNESSPASATNNDFKIFIPDEYKESLEKRSHLIEAK